MDAETLKKKLQKQNPLMMSPMAFALAACGGGSAERDDDGVLTQNIAIADMEIESNNYNQNANLVTEDIFSGVLSGNDDVDVFRINTNSGAVRLTYKTDLSGVENTVKVVDSKYAVLFQKNMLGDSAISLSTEDTDAIYLTIESDYVGDSRYTFSLEEAEGKFESEPNGTFQSADLLEKNEVISGQSYGWWEDDYFLFTATSYASSVTFNSDDTIGYHKLTIFDWNQEVIATEIIDDTGTISSATFPGYQYYLLIESPSGDDSNYSVEFADGDPPKYEVLEADRVYFVEQDTPESPLDYDWAILDRANGKFALHIEDSERFDAIASYIESGEFPINKYVIAYNNLNTKHENFPSLTEADFDWISADNVEVFGEGASRQIVVTDSGLQSYAINYGYNYIQFGVFIDNGKDPILFMGNNGVSGGIIGDFAISEGYIA